MLFDPKQFSYWPDVLEAMWSDKYDRYPRRVVAELISRLLGLPLLGYGSYRAVFLLKKGFVLKVAIDQEGVAQIYREARYWRMFPESVKHCFVPCLEAGDGWAVFPRVRPYHPGSGEPVLRKVREMLDYLRKYSISTIDLDPVDNGFYALNNWGRYKGRLVCLDYAFQWLNDEVEAA